MTHKDLYKIEQESYKISKRSFNNVFLYDKHLLPQLSICLASYNGEKYIKEQLDSILPQLKMDDEIIIVDDGSLDTTVDIIKKINDPRIKIFQNEINKGVNASFEKAIFLSRGDIIFLADQDDIWIEGRVEIMVNALIQENVCLVSSNISCFGATEYICRKYESNLNLDKSKKYLRNIIDIFIGRPNYFGCAMAFKKELKNIILPIPVFVESHDLWIAMAANILKSNIHIKEKTLYRRIHDTNASLSKRNTIKKIKSRIIFIFSIVVIKKRIKLVNKEVR